MRVNVVDEPTGRVELTSESVRDLLVWMTDAYGAWVECWGELFWDSTMHSTMRTP